MGSARITCPHFSFYFADERVWKEEKTFSCDAALLSLSWNDQTSVLETSLINIFQPTSTTRKSTTRLCSIDRPRELAWSQLWMPNGSRWLPIQEEYVMALDHIPFALIGLAYHVKECARFQPMTVSAKLSGFDRFNDDSCTTALDQKWECTIETEIFFYRFQWSLVLSGAGAIR